MTFSPRTRWADAPDSIRTAVAEALGSAVVDHTDLHGGMSPGPAVRLRLADGRQSFVKAVSAEVRAHNHRMIAQESAILDILPPSVSAPRRLASPRPSSPGTGSRTGPGRTGSPWLSTSRYSARGEGVLTGPLVVVGFALSLALSAI